MIINIINQYLPMLLQAVMITVFGIAGVVLKSLAQKYIDDDTKRALARTVVAFVEQVYTDLHGADKLAAAVKTFTSLLAERNITVSEAEMKILLEAAVAEFNEAFKRSKTTVGLPEVQE